MDVEMELKWNGTDRNVYFLHNSNLIVQHLFEIVKTFIMLQNISVSFDQFKASLGELRINFFLFNHTYPKLLNSSVLQFP